jgi:hypothetical protein
MQQVQMELTRILSGLKHEIPIFLFTRVGKNEVFNDAARQALAFFQADDRQNRPERIRPDP